MSIPERFLFDNLVWTSTGDIWATWRLTPLQRPVTENASLTVAAAHRDLFRPSPATSSASTEPSPGPTPQKSSTPWPPAST
ncbi:hypothetical protein HMPREF9573_00009 [Cutibacterium acnes HL072PA2]|nr:hypothetical protein HMPREF9573_00009 [Cutibacterium acnes HL072PA2]